MIEELTPDRLVHVLASVDSNEMIDDPQVRELRREYVEDETRVAQLTAKDRRKIKATKPLIRRVVSGGNDD
jgi:hypothetical protein